jgi:uncharacterized membrane protein YhaH (DUF805 family)
MSFWFWLFFSWRGRLGRGFFWLAALAVVLAVLLLDMALGDALADPAGMLSIPGAVFILLNAVLGYSAIAVAAKRFHDRGKTGWLAPIAGVILLAIGELIERNALVIASAAEHLLAGDTSRIDATVGTLLGVCAVGGCILLWLAVCLGFIRGNAGQNSYGADPRISSGGDAI